MDEDDDDKEWLQLALNVCYALNEWIVYTSESDYELYIFTTPINIFTTPVNIHIDINRCREYIKLKLKTSVWSTLVWFVMSVNDS